MTIKRTKCQKIINFTKEENGKSKMMMDMLKKCEIKKVASLLQERTTYHSHTNQQTIFLHRA
jgi:hypothetical protein